MRIDTKSRSSRLELFCKKVVLKNSAKFIGKHVCQSLFFNKLVGLSLVDEIKMGNVVVFIIPETKIDESFPVGNFLIDSFSSPYSVDCVSAVGNILLYIREDISSNYAFMQS